MWGGVPSEALDYPDEDCGEGYGGGGVSTGAGGEEGGAAAAAMATVGATVGPVAAAAAAEAAEAEAERARVARRLERFRSMADFAASTVRVRCVSFEGSLRFGDSRLSGGLRWCKRYIGGEESAEVSWHDRT